jgi:hypothetical protein
MNKTIMFYQDLSGTLHVLDPEALPQTEQLSPILEIATAVIRTGLKGVRVDQQQMANGRYLLAMDVNIETLEGQILQRLGELQAAGQVLPSARAVLSMISQAYQQKVSWR